MSKFFKKSLVRLAAAAGLFLGVAAPMQAGITTTSFESTDALENTGVTFDGTVKYDDVLKLLTIDLRNTSGFQSVITGFYFNIAGNAIATYNVVDAPTVGVNEGSFAAATSLAPFGTFDSGVTLQNLSQQQVRGIDEGETGTFTFNLSGADAGTLTSIDFLTDTNSGGGLTGAFAVRYQSVGLNAELSDKVFGAAIGGGGQPPVVPLPPAAWMGLVTMGMIGLRQLRQRKLLAAA